MRPLLPHDAIRCQVESEQQRLPLGYFSGRLPVPQGWDDRPMAYLAFGETYADDRRTAIGRGWPVTTLAGAHLHMLVDPPAVVAELDALIDRLS